MDTATRARELALLGIEVRATQSQNTGTQGGGQTAHAPAGQPTGGQFTANPGGGGSSSPGYKSILPPDSGYKSGGTSKPKAAAAAPAPPSDVPQAPATPRTMKSGDSGEDVRYAQYAMNLLGFKVAQDGQYGPETEAAVKQIQERLGMKKPNGHLSSAQLRKLQDAVRLSPCIGAGQRDLEAEAQWEARFAEPEEEDLDDDGMAEAVTDALDEFVARSFYGDWEERAHDVSGELRIPGGAGGGRWTKSPVTAAILKALKEAKGPDSFTLDGKPIEREPLRKAAVARGITLKRGASRDDIVKALLDDVHGEKAAPSAPSPRADAKAKYAAVAQSRPYASAAAAIAELTGKKQSNAVIAEHVRAIAHPDSPDMRDTGNADPAAIGHDLEQVAAAFEAGNPALGKRRMTAALKKQGITQGPVGTVPFDPAAHEHLGDVPAAGTPVAVVRPGMSLHRGEGDHVQLSKAVVKSAPGKAPAKTAKAAPGKSALVGGRDITQDRTAIKAAYEAGKENGEWGPSRAGPGSQRGGRVAEGGYQAHLALAHAQGFDGSPRVIGNDAEVGRLEKQGWRPLYRGWGWGAGEDSGKTGSDMANQYLYGPLHVGGGLGLGTNMSDNHDAANYYASHDRFTPIPGGKTVGFLLSPAAKVIRYPDAVRQRDEYLAKLPTGPEHEAERKVFEDPGTFAMSLGYDAMVANPSEAGIVKKGTEEWVIFNRTAVAGIDENKHGAADFARKQAGAEGIDLLREAAGSSGFTFSDAGEGARSTAEAKRRAAEFDALTAKGYFRKTGKTGYTITDAGRQHLAGTPSNPAEILSSLPADLTPGQQRARLRSKGVSKEEIDALVPLAPKKATTKPARVGGVTAGAASVAALPRASGPVETHTAAKATNPHFGSTLEGGVYRDAGRAGERYTPDMGPLPSGAYEENCTNVVQAFEMRMRGYDVQAAPLDFLDKHGYAAGRTAAELDQQIETAWRLSTGKPHGRSFKDQKWRSFDEIDSEVEQWPEGGRGTIFVGKHIFSVVKVDGKAQYIEAQFGKGRNRDVTAHYRRKYDSSGGAKLIRLDDLVPTDGILDAVRA